MAFGNWRSLTTEQRKMAVAPLLDQGLSASKIAAQFTDCTRNSIIGFCHRHKLHLGNAAQATHAAEVRKSEKPSTGEKRKYVRRAPPAEDVSHDEPAAPIEEMPAPEIDAADHQHDAIVDGLDWREPKMTGPLSILQLLSNSCRMPLVSSFKGLAPEDMMFCGKPSPGISVWCDEHRKKVFEVRHR